MTKETEQAQENLMQGPAFWPTAISRKSYKSKSYLLFEGCISNCTSDHADRQLFPQMCQSTASVQFCMVQLIVDFEMGKDSMSHLILSLHVVVTQKNDAVHLDHTGS